MDELLELARWTDLPRTYEEIFKRTLDHRGRPVKSLDPSTPIHPDNERLHEAEKG